MRRYQHVVSLLRRESIHKAGLRSSPDTFSDGTRIARRWGTRIPPAWRQADPSSRLGVVQADRYALANGRRVWESVGFVRLLREWSVDAGEVLLQAHADDATVDGLVVVAVTIL
jgi:hypothetical protein